MHLKEPHIRSQEDIFVYKALLRMCACAPFSPHEYTYTQKEPCTHTKEPYMHSKEPHIRSQEDIFVCKALLRMCTCVPFSPCKNILLRAYVGLF